MTKREKEKIMKLVERLEGAEVTIRNVSNELEAIVENIFNEQWGSRGPDCLAVPLAAAGGQ